LLTVSVALIALSVASAQDEARLRPGDPPRAALITVSPPNDNGIVTISGAQNAVFPAAQLAVRNLYTQETIYTQAGITGTFSAQLYGPGSTPFLISPAENIPQALRNRPGSLPGGPAVIIYGSLPTSGPQGVSFTVDGTLGGAGVWSARGTANRVNFEAEDPASFNLRLDVVVPLPTAAVALSDLRFTGTLSLLPVAVRQDDTIRALGAPFTNNGWSGIRTESGFAVDDIGATVLLGDVTVGADDIVPVVDGLAFRFEFNYRLSERAAPGLYVPILQGFVRTGASQPEPWETTGLFGQGAPRATAPVRLPLVLNIGGLTDVPLPWVLLMNTPSDGSRGLLSLADQTRYTLSNRVRYNAPTYILPPNAGAEAAAYSLEPSLLMQLPNTYNLTSPPLLPLQLPGGTLEVRIQAPDGSLFESGARPIVQNQLSTPALDERTAFGAQSPLDIYQLTSFDEALRSYSFTQYGEHIITLEGSVEDAFGNQYVGGGQYRVVVAEPFDLTPGVLPGTPFELGDAFSPALHIAPGLPAEVTLVLRVFPLDGGAPVERRFEGLANGNGYFYPGGEPFIFETPGEYVVDYEVRHTDRQGRLWAGSMRSGGVIADGARIITARGTRGIQGITALRPPRYDARRLLDAAEVETSPLVIYPPYHSGDAAWLPDGTQTGLQPTLHIQDLLGSYRDWLAARFATNAAPLGATIRSAAATEELPAALFTDAGRPYNPADDSSAGSLGYRYVSVVSPGVTIRQFVSGSIVPELVSWVDMDDPLNGQIGAGFAGMQPGDFMFVFGGVYLRSHPLALSAVDSYASLVSVIGSDDAQGTRVGSPARGADGGDDTGALVTIDGVDYDAFLVPTGVRPGDVLALGDMFTFSGQAAPTLPVVVQVQVTAPSGSVRLYTTRANKTGYVYDPQQDFPVDEAGVWWVETRVILDVLTSIGPTEPPFPSGGILGAPSGRYAFYVTQEETERLAWNARPDVSIPSALPYNFAFTLPEGWSDATVYYTISVPGYLVEGDTLRLSGRSFDYLYSPAAIGRGFPNIEVEGRVSGAAGSDARQITFFVVAKDELGAQRILYRTFTIFHDRLLSPDS
jgi:hypothetical protein